MRRRAGRETEKRTSTVAHPKSVDRSGQASAKDRKITHTKAASAAYGAGRQNTRYGLYSSDRPSGPSLRSLCSITVYHINIGFARIFSILLDFIEKRRESAKRGSFDRRRCLAEAYSDSPQTAAVSRGNAASRRRRNGYFPQGGHRACKTVDCRPRRMYNDKRLGVPPARSAEKYPLNLVKLALAKGSKNLFGILSSP